MLLLAEKYQLRFYRRPARPSSARPAPPRLKKAESVEEPQPRCVFISLNYLNLCSKKEILIMVQSVQEWKMKYHNKKPNKTFKGDRLQFFFGLFSNIRAHMCRSMVKNKCEKPKVKMDHREGEKQVVGKIFVKKKCEKTLCALLLFWI